MLTTNIHSEPCERPGLLRARLPVARKADRPRPLSLSATIAVAMQLPINAPPAPEPAYQIPQIQRRLPGQA